MYDFDAYEWGDSLLTPAPELADTWPHPRHTQEPDTVDHEVVIQPGSVWSYAECVTCGWKFDEFDLGKVRRVAADHGTVFTDPDCRHCWGDPGWVPDPACRHRGYDFNRCWKPCPNCRPDVTYRGCAHKGAA